MVLALIAGMPGEGGQAVIPTAFKSNKIPLVEKIFLPTKRQATSNTTPVKREKFAARKYFERIMRGKVFLKSPIQRDFGTVRSVHPPVRWIV